MADGDAMRFISEELGTAVGLDTDGGSGVATSWTYGFDPPITAATTTIDAVQQRTGAGCQKILFSSSGAGNVWISQNFTLPGRADLAGKGHVGATFTLSFYAKQLEDKGVSAQVFIEEYDASNVRGSYNTPSAVVLTTAYQLISISYTIADSDVSYIKVYLQGVVSKATSDVDIYLDDASFKFDYTVSTNPTGSMGLTYSPSLPETGEASINNTYYRQRNVSTALKFRDVSLNFGLTPTAQKNALRAMTFYDKLFTWYPYNPDLPSTLDGYFQMLGQPVPIGTRWNRWGVKLRFDER